MDKMFTIIVDKDEKTTEKAATLFENKVAEFIISDGSVLDIQIKYITFKPLTAVLRERRDYPALFANLRELGIEPDFCLIGVKDKKSYADYPHIKCFLENDIEALNYTLKMKIIEEVNGGKLIEKELSSYAVSLIESTLCEFGFSSKHSGTEYAKEILKIMCSGTTELTAAMSKELYPAAAKHYGTSCSAIERNLRTALMSGWRRSDVKIKSMYFGNYIIDNGFVPGNREFMCTIADKLKNQIEVKRGELKREILKMI